MNAQLVAKRAFDIALSTAGLLVLGPLILIVATAIRLRMGKPVFFAQVRPGKDGRLFRLVKFRTMSDQRDSSGRLLPDSERITKLGSFLRSTSLDELPQLWNVFRGDMSLVGPRPLLPEYLDLYTAEQSRRHEVRPGITGWAQVNGRNATTWEDRLARDVWYVDNWSLVLDAKILLMTFSRVLRRTGVNNSAKNPMPRFEGTTKE